MTHNLVLLSAAKRTAYSRGAIRGEEDGVLPRRNSGRGAIRARRNSGNETREAKLENSGFNIQNFEPSSMRKILKVGFVFEKRLRSHQSIWKFLTVIRDFCLGRGLRYLWVERFISSLYCGVGFGVGVCLLVGCSEMRTQIILCSPHI
jgi:hypothetical protein